MSYRKIAARLLVTFAALAVAACADSSNPLEPGDAAANRGVAQDRLAEVFARVSPAVMSRAGTVFADHDESANKLVFGVTNANAGRGVQQALAALGVASPDYDVVVTEPIYNMATLRDRFRPTQGGIQIHFPGFLCTMGFNVDHGAGRSFITNSHCTSTQGGTEGTPYWQPISSVDGTVIATEVDDPVYWMGFPCSAGKKCRYSDAARALYSSGTASERGVIAKTTGVNNGSLTVAGAFSVSAQDNGSTRFSGTVHKVGRTTGWTSGNVTNTCATVNVSGSTVQLLCQTIVQNSAAAIVGGGDSGSPVFTTSGGDNVTLIGILWGGSGSSLFVFSPLKGIQDELGAFTATTGGSAPPPPPPPPDEDEPPCVPKGKSGKNCK